MPAFLAALPAIIGGAQAIGGLLGKAFGKKRPEYEIPESVRQAVSLAALDAGSPYAPGYEEARAGLDVASSNALSMASQSGLGSASSLGAVVGQQEAGLRSLAADNAAYRAGAQERYQNALTMLGGYEEKEWQLNEFAPHAQQQTAL